MRFLNRIVTTGLLIGAGTLAIAGNDDLEYARALAREGHTELAQEWCGRMRRDPKTAAEDRVGVRLVEADILARAAGAQESAAEARKRLDEAVAALEAFLAEAPGHRLAAEAKLQCGMLRRQQGELIAYQAAAEADAAAREVLRGEGREAYGRAERVLSGVAGEMAAAREAWVRKTDGRKPTEKERAEEEAILSVHLEADLQGARSIHGRARLLDGPPREKTLREALDAFMEFELSWGDTPVLHEASLTWALVYGDLGMAREGLSRFDHAISLRESFRQPNGKFAFGAWEHEIVLRGYGGKAQALNEAKDFAGALAAVDEMLAVDPAAASDRNGFLALLQKCDALAGLGRGADAAALAQQLAKAAPSPALAALASRRLAGAVPAGATAEMLALVAEQQLAAGQWETGLKTLRRAVARAGDDRLAAELWWKLGRAYEVHAERLFDAATVYERLALDFPAHDRAPEAAFMAARAWNRIAAQAGVERGWEKDQVERNLTLLARTWPKNPFAKDAQYLVAEALYERGRVLEAAKEFAQVAPEAGLYEQAQVAAGQAYFQAAAAAWGKGDRGEATRALFGRAEESFRKYLAIAQAGPAANPRTQELRPSVSASCGQVLAALLMHESNPRPAEALAAAGNLDATAPDADTRRRVASIKVRALLALGQHAGAAATADSMMEKFPDAPAALDACRFVASACDAAAEEIAGPAPVRGRIPAQAAQLWSEAARFYHLWASRAAESGDISAADMLRVSDRVFALGLLVNGLEEGLPANDSKPSDPSFFAHAADLYGTLSEGRPGPAPNGTRVHVPLAWSEAHGGDWEAARDALERLVQAERIAGPGGRDFNPSLVATKPWVFSAFEDLGHVYLHLAESGTLRDSSYDAAYAIFAGVVVNAPKDTAGWWRTKAGVLRVLFERGKPGDFEAASLGMSDLRSNYPDFDGGRFGMKAGLESLERRIREKEPK
ncbi:MAG: hypothetical protein HYY18_08740 [Planctomycetes bacterium]|nr:hypothetical protein [Planctomycetota bacterium]